MRWLLGAVTLLTGLIAGSIAPRPSWAATPAPLTSSIAITQENAGLSAADMAQIADKIEEILAFHQRKNWQCLRLPVEGQTTHDVQIGVKIIRQGLLDSFFSTDYRIEVTLTAPGLGTITDTEEWQPEEGQESPRLIFIRNLGERVAGSLGSIMEKQSPCRLSAKFQGKLIQGEGVQAIATYSAAAELELDENGAFAQTLPLVASISLPIEGCTSDYRYINPQLYLAGGYRGDDQRLVFESARMTWDGVVATLACGAVTCTYNSRATSACTSSAGTITRPPWDDFSGMDPAAGGITLAFTDGASGSLNRPSVLPGDAFWESSLELRTGVGDRAPAVAFITTSN